MDRYVAYYRVSTRRQGDSGLGLEAQREAVDQFLAARNGTVFDEFIEVESGSKSSRPELLKAIDTCRLYNLPLLVAKLDRLSRNAAFLMTLSDSEVKFTCADMPEATQMIVGIMATVAQEEREMISRRTKAALAQAKKRGAKLGGYRPNANLTDDARQRAVAARNVKANERAEQYRRIFERLRVEGFDTHRSRAAELTRRAIPNPSGTGSKWYAQTAQRVAQRLKFDESDDSSNGG